MLADSPLAESRFFAAPDGLTIHLRDYRPQVATARNADATPVVCLPGLTRTTGDFDDLARALSGGASRRPRRVVAIDYRGRGLSAWDPDPSHYDIYVENADIVAVLAAAGIGRAIFVGTSRGGLHLFVLAAVRPTLVRGAVLNDIGPVIEATGLARIRAYVGNMPVPATWDEAVAIIKRLSGGSFTNLGEADWHKFARLTYAERNGRLATLYDPALSRSLAGFDLEAPLPVLWRQFDGLRHVPILAIRGANSDLLSSATLAEMGRRHPDCETYVVDGQGHAPLLWDAASLAKIQAFVERADPEHG